MRDPVEPPHEDAETRRFFSRSTLLIALVFMAACAASFLLVAVGFGHRG